jgi:hypothetical protein
MALGKSERERVERNVRAATTDDLLDRVTAYRTGNESDAVALMEVELSRRGYGAAEVRHHANELGEVLRYRDGTAVRCSVCPRPAVRHGWAWHRLWGAVPLFPRRFRWCKDHAVNGRVSQPMS